MGCCSSLILFTSNNDSDWRTQQNQTSSSHSQAVPVLEEQALKIITFPHPGPPQSQSEPLEPVEVPNSVHNQISSSQAVPVLDEQALESLNDPFFSSSQSLSESSESNEDQNNLHSSTLENSSQPIEAPGKPPTIIENGELEATNPSSDCKDKLQQQQLPESSKPSEDHNNVHSSTLENSSQPKDPSGMPPTIIENGKLEATNPSSDFKDKLQRQQLPESSEPVEDHNNVHSSTLENSSPPIEPPGKPPTIIANGKLEDTNPSSDFKDKLQQQLPESSEPVEDHNNVHSITLENSSQPIELPGKPSTIIENGKLEATIPSSDFKDKLQEQQLPESSKPIEDHNNVHSSTLKNSSQSKKSPGKPPTIIENGKLEPTNPSSDFKDKLQQQQQQLPEVLPSLPAAPISGSIPDAPSYAPSVSEVTSSAATLSWYGSSYDGGSQVTGYNIEAKKLPEETWITLVKGCHSTSYKTKNLKNGSEYQFRVRAANVHGVSEPSKPSEPVTIQEQVNHKNNNNSIGDYDEKFPPFELKKVSIEPADIFNEEYDLSGELGRGRFGVVYKVKHKKTGQTRAAKVIKCIRATDKQGVRDEIDLMNSLRHPRLLQIAAAYERKRDIVMVLELISGGELFDRVIADDFDLTEKDCIFFMRQICEGLQYMHDNKILHLDLKPENILCVHKNSNHIKLIDFGLSRRFDPEKSMQVLHGTPEFIAPEVINYDPISYTSDMWSVGVICYVLLTGLSPFMGDNDAETLANITNGDYDFDDESFDDITQNAKDFITALLVKKKEDRLTATTCLKHKWLNQKEDSTTKVVLSTDKLKKFTLKRKWQKTGLAIKALGRIASLTSCTSPVSPIPSNYPPVSSPPSSPLTTSSTPPLPMTPSSPPSLTTVSSPVSPAPVLYTSKTVINLAPVAVNSIAKPVKD